MSLEKAKAKVKEIFGPAAGNLGKLRDEADAIAAGLAAKRQRAHDEANGQAADAAAEAA